MSSQIEEQNQLTDITKPKIMTGYIHYNKSDDLGKLFETLNDFRKNSGLKYSHQGNVGMVFFNVGLEHLDELSEVRPFKISKFHSKSEYKCDKETSDKLMGQKDSFVRMTWDESTTSLTFLSRTTSRVHGNLVRRIFKDSQQNFDRDAYSVVRENMDGENVENNENGDQQDQVEQQRQSRQPRQSYHTRSYTQKVEEAPEGFTRVARRGFTNNTTNNKEFNKEFKGEFKGEYKGERPRRTELSTQNTSRTRVFKGTVVSGGSGGSVSRTVKNEST